MHTRQPVMRRAVAQRAEAIYKERFADKETGTLPATFQVRQTTQSHKDCSDMLHEGV